MLKQVVQLIRLFGLPTLVRRKRNHDKALPMLRGYAGTICFTTLLNAGFFDEIQRTGSVDPEHFARERGMNPEVLEHIVEYLDCIHVVRREGNLVTLDTLGERLLSDPRGSFELTHGYQPVLHQLDDLLMDRKRFGRDVRRLGDYIARGSGRLGRQLPFPVMKHLVEKHGSRRVLDLGAGNVEFLELLCEGTDIRCRGVEIDPDAVAEARRQLDGSPVGDRIEILEGDMFDVAPLRERWPDIDGVIAIDTFHEYIKHHRERVVDLLRQYREAFPEALFYVAEFCRQPHAWLRKHPTSFVEHHLFHNLTDQQILSADEWETLFDEANLEIVDRTVFSMVGHGYFVVK